MMEYQANLQSPYYEYVRDGLKTVEGRINRGKWKQMMVGDMIVFNGTIKVRNVRKIYYDTFKDLLKREGLKETVPTM